MLCLLALNYNVSPVRGAYNFPLSAAYVYEKTVNNHKAISVMRGQRTISLFALHLHKGTDQDAAP